MSQISENLEAMSPLKRALLALTDMQARVDAVERARSEPLAIIGMGCRLPGGAVNPQAFWRMLRDGVDGISEIPPERWDIDSYYDPDPAAPGKMNTRWGGFLDRVDEFDAAFFGIAPREAVWMDPQQRLLLEVAWEALEEAGQTARQWSRLSTGVFVGVSSSDYVWHQLSGSGQLDAYTSTGNSYSIVANRLSYLLDLKGPSLVVDTACSSSLVAVHLACQSLRNRECHLALAGGVNLVLSPMGTISLSKYGMMAPDGRSKAFDAAADGFVRGEGCGLVVLKRLSDALAADDPILALIRGSAVNQDGRSNGLTAPNSGSQQAVIRQALAQAGVAPRELQYIEAHGTGTALGDPIETGALGAVLGPRDGPAHTCALGSVKANIGHLEAAAGIAGLIKVVLSMQHEAIPPQVHFRALNPHIDLAHTPLVIAPAGRPWRRGSRPRLAGVSSFGFGGTNAHAVLEEAAQRRPQETAHAPAEGRVFLLPLSARSPHALTALARSYQDYLKEEPPLYDVCYTASVRRNHHANRVAVLGRSPAELAERLQDLPPFEQVCTPPPPGPVFVFGDQSELWAGMGRDLLSQEPVLREAVDQCEAVLRPYVDWSLTEELLADDAMSRLGETEIAEPALLALQAGLAALWRSWGIEPAAVMGHGTGEIAAAYVAGALNLADAVRVAVHRGRALPRVHSQNGIEAELEQALCGLHPNPAILPITSALTGRPCGGDFEPRYWARQLREPVRFAEAVASLAAQGHEVFLEISPLPTLGSAITQCLAERGREGVALASLRRKCSQREVMLASLGRLYTLGYSVEWDRLYKPAGRSVPLPVYPWQRERFWPVGTQGRADKAPRRADTHPLLGERLPQDASSKTRCWQTELSRSSCPFLNDHRVQGAMVLPAAAYVEMALAASAEALGAGPYAIEQINFLKALFLPEDASRTVRFVMSTAISGAASFEILSRRGSEWVLHATGTIGRGYAGSPRDSAEQIRSRCPEMIDGTEHYQGMQKQGLEYGPSFQGVLQIWRRDGEALGRLQLPYAAAARASAHHVYPALLDAGFQLLAAAVPGAEARLMAGDIYLPVNLGTARTYVRPDPGAELWGHVLVRSSPQSGTDAFEGDVFLMDAEGRIAVEALGLRVQRLERAGRPEASDRWRDWLYEIHWQPEQLPQPAQTFDRAGRWLILADSSGVGKAVGTQLKARGESCVTIVRDEFGAARPEEFQRLLHQAFGDAPPQGIIHLWSLDAPPSEALTLASLEAAQQAGCGSLLHLVQALAQMPWRPAPRLWLVSRGAKAVGRSSLINLAPWPLSGLARVIAIEHAELQCTEVDLSWEASTEEIAALVEEFAANDMEAQVALRGGIRYKARMVRAPLESAAEVAGLSAEDRSKHNVSSPQDKSATLIAPVARAPFSLREEGTYLITGGLGGLGLQVARWMVERGARHLVLVGRGGASESNRGEISSLEQAGAQVLVVRADVSSAGQMAALFAQIDRDLPLLRGVIHAAGVLDDGVLLQQDWQRFANVMAPKVTGAWNLHTLTLGRPLDFFVLFSSMGAVVGSPGQGNYASANAFLDGLAYYRLTRGLPALSINWGPWAEVGMAAATPRRVERTRLRGIGAIAPQAGLQVLEQLLRQPRAQIGVMPINWHEFQAGAAAPLLLADLIAQEAPGHSAAERQESRFGEALRTAQPEERLALLETYLREQLGRVLGSPLSVLDIHQPLSNAGFDSLMAIELTAKIQHDLRVKVPITHALQGPSLRQMSEYLLEQLTTQWLLEPPRGNPAESEAEEWEVLTL